MARLSGGFVVSGPSILQKVEDATRRLGRVNAQDASTSDSRRAIRDRTLKALSSESHTALSRRARGQPLALSGIFQQGNFQLATRERVSKLAPRYSRDGDDRQGMGLAVATRRAFLRTGRKVMFAACFYFSPRSPSRPTLRHPMSSRNTYFCLERGATTCGEYVAEPQARSARYHGSSATSVAGTGKRYCRKTE